MSTLRLIRSFVLVLAIGFSLCVWFPVTARAVSTASAFRPVNPEELKMTSEPMAPGAPAVILYREFVRDDTHPLIAHEDSYYRIKIFTEEGRKYGDVEVPFFTSMGNITGLRARTIKPDGTIVDFDGKVFTKVITRSRGEKILARTFTLPAVEPGCVIEYFYTLDLKGYGDDPESKQIFDSSWIVSEDLFTKSVNFSLRPYMSEFNLHWLEQHMPPGSPHAQEGPDHVIRLQLTNVPGFQPEELMPPEDELKARVDFIYSLEMPEQDPQKYWAKVGKRMDAQLESFIGKHKSMEEAVAQIVSPNDPPEVKLRKIYAKVQQLRNTSYEPPKTAEEIKQAKGKPPSSAEEVWQRGYGSGGQLTWLYLALVRAAGIDAYGVWASGRQRYFFQPSSMQSGRLDSNLVVVKLNGKDIFCDPGAAFTPFGLLPWQETGVLGLQLDKKGATWIPTLTPVSSQAHTERRANLTLSDNGDLEGSLTVTYTDLEAASLRRYERNSDETERKSALEKAVKAAIPAASEAKLTNQPEWKDSTQPLVAEFNIKVPGWASAAGHHVILPVGVFGGREKHVFEHLDRTYPIYVDYPYSVSDDVSIQVPPGWHISSLPPGWTDTGKVVSFSLNAGQDKGKLHLTRNLDLNFILMDVKYYAPLHQYFQQIKSADDQQIVLEPAAPRASN